MITRKYKPSFRIASAGLSDSSIQKTVSSLRYAAANPEEHQIVEEWLAAVQVVEVATGMLLSEIHRMEANLHFWEKRMQEGQHLWFALFKHGPISFAKSLYQLIPFRNPPPSEQDANAAELAERRTLLFSLLRTAATEALGQVQSAGYTLDLQYLPEDGDGDAEDAALMGAALFSKAKAATSGCLNAVTSAYNNLKVNVQQIMEQHVEEMHRENGGTPAESYPHMLGIRHLQQMQSARRSLVRAQDRGPGAARRPPRSPRTPRTPTPQLQAHPVPGSIHGAALRAAQAATGFQALVAPDEPVHTTLMHARRASAHLQRTQHLIQLPEWAPMPSHAQRQWVRYLALGMVSGYGIVFLVRHSPICGSSDLQDWTQLVLKTIHGAWKVHIIEPLAKVQGELFDTFRRRPAIVSMKEYEADRDSLKRMLDEFKTDYLRRKKGGSNASTTRLGPSVAVVPAPTSAPGPGAAPGQGTPVEAPLVADIPVVEGMELMMRSYEEELKQPIRHLISGDLLRSVLIQVQKLKVDTESAMLEIDQILRANELSISLVAAIPAFAIAGSTLYGLSRWLAPPPPDPRREAVPVRMAMIEVERALSQLVMEEEQGDMSMGQQGLVLYKVAVAYEKAEGLFDRHRGLFRSEGEWPLLQADLMDLAGNLTPDQKLRITNRMMKSYSVYQQFG